MINTFQISVFEVKKVFLLSLMFPFLRLRGFLEQFKTPSHISGEFLRPFRGRSHVPREFFQPRKIPSSLSRGFLNQARERCVLLGESFSFLRGFFKQLKTPLLVSREF